MAIQFSRRPKDKRRRAVVAVQVAVSAFLIIGFAALTIDVGVMYNTRADLQRAADAAALAGVSAYTSDEMMQVRLGQGSPSLLYEVLSSAGSRVDAFAASNPSLGTATTLIEANDVVTGWIDVTSATSPIQSAVPADAHNAVRVVARRSNQGPNGPVELSFSSIFGFSETESSASAVAVFDDRAAGFCTEEDARILMPFTIHEDIFAAELVGGSDNYGYDDDSESVINGSDGIREIKLYPYVDAPGNFGLLNIGTPNQGVPALGDQIENGVPPEDVEAEIGTTTLTFYDECGDPITLDITGSPGLDVALQPSIETRVGDVVAFLLHDQVVDGGSNTVYTITQIRFGRVMDILLQGASFSRGFWIQPLSYSGPGVVISEHAGSSNGLAGRIVLAR